MEAFERNMEPVNTCDGGSSNSSKISLMRRTWSRSANTIPQKIIILFEIKKIDIRFLINKF